MFGKLKGDRERPPPHSMLCEYVNIIRSCAIGPSVGLCGTEQQGYAPERGSRCPVSGVRSPVSGARSPEPGARSPEPGARRSEPGLCSREEPISGLTCFVHRLQLYSPVLRFGILFNLSPRLIKQFKLSLNELIKEFLLLIPFTVGLYTKSSHCLFRRPTPDVPFS